MQVRRFGEQARALLGATTRDSPVPSGKGSRFTIEFVCTGNICRSPFAASTLTHMASRSDLESWLTVSSAGTHAVEGCGMDPSPTRIFEAQFGKTAPPHSARQLTDNLADHADLLLAMEAEQRRTLLRMSPQAFPRTFMITEYVMICRKLLSSGDVDWKEHGQTPTSRLRALTAGAARHRSLAADAPDIADPYRHDMKFHENVAGQIRTQVEELISILGEASALTG